MMVNKSTIYIVIIVLLLVAVIFLGVGLINTNIELKNQSQIAKVQQTNIKVVDFLRLFVTNVLKNKQEVTFEQRLQLENAVLDLQDQQILDQWHKFTESETEADAQKAAIDLLDLLVQKTR